MEGRIRILFLNLMGLVWAGVVLWGSSALAADPKSASTLNTSQRQVIEPEVVRRDVKLADIDTEDFEVGAYIGLMSVEDFGVNTVYGIRIAYHVTESIFIEAALGQTTTGQTSYERLSGGAQLLTDDERELTYYNVSIGYNVLPGEAFLTSKLAFNTAVYVIAGMGSTKFAGDDRSTFNFGAGYRFLATDWLAIHADVRDHIFEIDLLGEKKTTQNIEIHGGITIFF